LRFLFNVLGFLPGVGAAQGAHGIWRSTPARARNNHMKGISMIKLGSKVRDIVTGFQGVAVARVEYLTGCEQIGIAPPVDQEGKVREAQYFDFTRLEVLDDSNVMNQLQPARDPQLQFAHTRGGPNRDCPR
jgi:hypothetical protein